MASPSALRRREREGVEVVGVSGNSVSRMKQRGCGTAAVVETTEGRVHKVGNDESLEVDSSETVASVCKGKD